jgi:hypothetical protein
MIMDKISNSEHETRALHNVESFVLDRLLTEHISKGDLIAQSRIHSSDGENYQITRDGINELDNRKREAISL